MLFTYFKTFGFLDDQRFKILQKKQKKKKMKVPSSSKLKKILIKDKFFLSRFFSSTSTRCEKSIKEKLLKSDLIGLRKKLIEKEVTIKDYYSIYFEYKTELEDYNIFISERDEKEIVELAEKRFESNKPLMGIPFIVNDNLDTDYLPTSK